MPHELIEKLEEALNFGSIDQVNLVLSQMQNNPEVDINELDDCGEFIFYKVVRYNSKEMIEVFLDYNKRKPINPLDINKQDGCGATVLFAATNTQNTEIINLLLDNGADANIADPNGYTPLHFAVGYYNNIEMARIYLERGANPNAVQTVNTEIDVKNLTPLHAAIYNKNLDMITLLISYGANPELKVYDQLDGKEFNARELYLDNNKRLNIVDYDLAVEEGLKQKKEREEKENSKELVISGEETLSEEQTNDKDGHQKSKKRKRDNHLESVLKEYGSAESVAKMSKLVELTSDENPSKEYIIRANKINNLVNSRIS